MIRVLHIANARMGSGGVESFLMNLYRNMDREKIQMDFVVFSDEVGMHEAEIARLGGRVYKVPRKKDGLFRNLNAIRKIVKENQYKIVHRNCDAAIMLLDILAAKLGGARYVIAHAHSTQNEHSFIHKVCKPFLRKVVKYRYACSDAAGKWMYGKASFEIIPNGIDCKQFDFQQNIRDKIRTQFLIPENTIVMGNVAVFKEVKNLSFLIDVFAEIHKRNDNTMLLLVGDGEERSSLENKVRELQLEHCIKFLGTRSNVNEIFMAMDIFILPSFYEGLPLTMVEAQTSGLKCYISDRVPDDAIINAELVEKVSLEENAEEWAEKILTTCDVEDRKHAGQVVRQAGYDIRQVAKKMQDFYLSLEG